MNPTTKAKLSQRAQALIDEGRAVIQNSNVRAIGDPNGPHLKSRHPIADETAFHKWLANCRVLISSLGAAGRPWIRIVDGSVSSEAPFLKSLLGTVQSLKEAIDNDLLTTVEDLVTADAFGSLLEQADELIGKGYVLAAGVLGRAVLEEHLRKACDRHGCLPVGRPTINDLNQALYKGSHLDKLAMKWVDTMAAAGNHCAHSIQPPLPESDVRKLLTDVQDFMIRHPLS